MSQWKDLFDEQEAGIKQAQRREALASRLAAEEAALRAQIEANTQFTKGEQYAAAVAKGLGLVGLAPGTAKYADEAIKQGGFGPQAVEMVASIAPAVAATAATGGVGAPIALGAGIAGLQRFGRDIGRGESVDTAAENAVTEGAISGAVGAGLGLGVKGALATKNAVGRLAARVLGIGAANTSGKAAGTAAGKAAGKAAGEAAESAGARAAGEATEEAAQRASQEPIEVIYKTATGSASKTRDVTIYNKARGVTPQSGDVLLKLPVGREIGKEGVEAATVQYGKPVTQAMLAAGVRPTPDPKLTLANIKLAKEEQRGVLEKLYGFLEQMPAGDASKIADTVRKLFLDRLQKAPLSAAEKQAVKMQAEAAVKGLPHEYRQLREVAGQGFEWSKTFYGVTIGSLQRLRESLKRLDAKGPLKEVYDDVRRRLDAVIQHQLLKSPSEAASQFADRLFTEKARWRVLKSLEEAIADGNWQRAKDLFSGETGKAIETLIQKGAANAEKMQASFAKAMRSQAKRAQAGKPPKPGASSKTSPTSSDEGLSSSVLDMASKLE
jgi:hypothetical protein